MEYREKTSFAMKASVRKKLDALQKRLRDAGLARGETSQSAIIEAAILTADADALQRYLER